MKAIFLISTVILCGLLLLAHLTLPEQSGDAPLIYWTSDPNPARGPQIAAFEKWIRDNEYGPANLELDSNNAGVMKVIIQSASGVASDVVDSYNGAQVRQYVSAGVLMDVTELAKEYGFSLDKTYAAAREEIAVDGKQYCFPDNVTALPLTINRSMLEKEGLPLPKYDWNWDEFLDWALKIKKVENGRVVRFAVYPFGADKLWATNGGSTFNETMTRCIANSDQNREASRFYYSLIFEHHVMPTQVDIQSASAREGYGGLTIQWLGTGHIAAVCMGRYALITLRQFKDFEPDVALLPYNVMPMQPVACRSVGINAGTKHRELAARFVQYLTSKPYNDLIIRDSDALPPNPEMARSPAFINPPEHPEEAEANIKYLRAVEDYGVGREYSPFVSPYTVERVIKKYWEGVDSKELTVDEALDKMTDEINYELKKTIDHDARLRKRYEQALKRQQQIDEIKQAGEAVPLEMIDNPVIRKLRKAGK